MGSSIGSSMTYGAVLTGGASTRFGSPKAVAEVQGVPMALRVAAALSGAGCDPVVAVGSVPGLAQVWAGKVAREAGSSGEIWPDRWPGEGPLGGVITALLSSNHDVVTAACDLPWLDTASVAAILKVAHSTHGVHAVHGWRSGRLVPVIWWSASAVPILIAAFDDGLRSLRGALDLLHTSLVEIRTPAAQGANSPRDLDRANSPSDGPPHCAR
jgi:molybdenum cofactor guanylyltransferase